MAGTIKWEPGDFRKGDRVEVKLKGPPGAAPVWKGGRVTEVTGRRGLFVKLDEGNTNFFWYSDIRPEASPPKAPEPPKMPKPVPRGLATIGDALAARSGDANHGLAVVVPVPAKQPSPPPAQLQVVREEPPVKRGPGRPKQAHRHQTSAIGNVFRAYRLREAATQVVVADLLGITNQLWSRIELGATDPSDHVLERFSVLSGMPYADLKRVRDGEPVAQVPAMAPVPAAVAPVAAPMPRAPEPELEPEPEAAPEPPPPVTQPAPVASGEAFEDFIDRLDTVVSIPVDKEQRRRWLAIARELHGMAGK